MRPLKPPSRRDRILLALPAVAFGALILVVSSRPGTDLPSTGIPQGDKGLHVAEYFVFGALLLLPCRGLGFRFRVPVLAAGMAFAAFDEFFQTFIPGRFGSAADFAMDVVGLLAALAVLLAAELARPAVKVS
jgi:VanZ family protein